MASQQIANHREDAEVRHLQAKVASTARRNVSAARPSPLRRRRRGRLQPHHRLRLAPSEEAEGAPIPFDRSHRSVAISDIFIDNSDLAKITFANSTGISRSFPVSAFQLDDRRNSCSKKTHSSFGAGRIRMNQTQYLMEEASKLSTQELISVTNIRDTRTSSREINSNVHKSRY
ncbi:hypothetical protein PanWU01x14_063830 [Parasponia andersonii]|uniref:Uncharacterized protein n=1 Tax=Parasponia andersonii TaxID=3476 RepID=A0A2P5DH41_PARAD|nr:hypothetical protein PanWU01x14_063830 [Parasponia andersonii]